MPSGWFEQDTSLFAGHPFIRGVVQFPRLGLVGRIAFLVDTGCGVTTIHPRDSQAISLDFRLLRQAGIVFGIGGNEPQFTEEAGISFIHGSQVVTYHSAIDIAPVLPHNRILPSLLGMDIIQHWRMVCDVHNGELEFQVHEADAIREMNTS